MKFGLDTPKNDGNGKVWIWIAVIIIVLLIVSFGCWTTTDHFANFKAKLTKSEKLKDLDIIMFMNPNCGYCRRMLDVLEAEKEIGNLKIVDVSTEEGEKIAKNFGVGGQVPSFVSLKYQTGHIGSTASSKELVKNLTPKDGKVPEKTETDNSVRGLGIIVFTREGCSYCIKAKEQLGKTGLLSEMTALDVTTDEGQKKIQELDLKVDSVPFFYCVKTGKIAKGFLSVDDVMNKLTQ
jgi:glutaredoxin